jgi:DNA-binding NtrC family response regulator
MNAPPPLIGVSQTTGSIRELIRHVADTGLNIVISGESGVGSDTPRTNQRYLI